MTANSQTSSFRISDIAFDTEIPNCQAQKKTHQRQEYVRKVIQVRQNQLEKNYQLSMRLIQSEAYVKRRSIHKVYIFYAV